jgi:hypothetical protein
MRKRNRQQGCSWRPLWHNLKGKLGFGIPKTWFYVFSLSNVDSMKHIVIIHTDTAITGQHDLITESPIDWGWLGHPLARDNKRKCGHENLHLCSLFINNQIWVSLYRKQDYLAHRLVQGAPSDDFLKWQTPEVAQDIIWKKSTRVSSRLSPYKATWIISWGLNHDDSI